MKRKFKLEDNPITLNSGRQYSLITREAYCTGCDTIKSFDDFYDDKFSRSNLPYLSMCKKCSSKVTVKRMQESRVCSVCGEDIAMTGTYRCKKCTPLKHVSADYNDKYIRNILTGKEKNLYGKDIPLDLVHLKRNLMALKKIIKLKLNKMDKDTKKVKAIVEVVKDAFKPVQFDQFHDAKKLNTILMSTLERLTEPEPTVTVGEAMAVAKLADMMIKNTLVELKKQQVATLITHVGVSQRTLNV